MKNWPQQFFVTGTDTEIGKTVVSSMLTIGLGGTYWKPIQSGLQEETDTQFVQRVTELGSDHFLPENYRLNEPLSPHASAAIDGVEITMQDITIPDYQHGPLIAEGAGGLLVPINDRHMIIDLIDRLKLSVVLVVRSELGTLNHTFLSLEALRKRQIPILGVVMNGPKNRSNRKAIERYGNVEILTELEPMEEITPARLKEEFDSLNATLKNHN